MLKSDLLYSTHLDVHGLSTTFVLQHQVICASVIFMCLFDDQLSDVIVSGNHGPMGNVTTILCPLDSWDGFTLNRYGQMEDSALSHHVTFLILTIKLVVGII